MIGRLSGTSESDRTDIPNRGIGEFIMDIMTMAIRTRLVCKDTGEVVIWRGSYQHRGTIILLLADENMDHDITIEADSIEDANEKMTQEFDIAP